MESGEGYANPFRRRKPRFTITAQNIEQYRDGLAPGVTALLKRNPNFRMPVYPTHRTAAMPKSHRSGADSSHAS
ncbi:MAG: DUF1329 domain-containing protein [Rhodocyclaceae bacterium]|nr:DUF1329 domain-containing protein [Rhodocyclaceae bacterium]